METKEMIAEIYEKIKYPHYTRGHTMIMNCCMIGDVLNYIDTECFRLGDNEYGLTEIDVKERERNVIWLYNHFIGKHNKSIEHLDDEGIKFVYNLISK